MKVNQAFIFGAGFGERLMPLTENRPKVTIPVLGKPNIFYIIERLKKIGITQFVINTHHKSELLQHIVGDGSAWDVSIVYSHEPNILDTGGGLKNAEHFITSDTFVVYNGDIFCDVDLSFPINFHVQNDSHATMIVSPKHVPRQLHISRAGKLLDIRGIRHYHSMPPTHTFLGIHILNREIFHYLSNEKKSIVEMYIKILNRNKTVMTWELDSDYWYDIGSIGAYSSIHADFFNKTRMPVSSQTIKAEGYISLSDNVVLEDNVFLKNVIVWENAVIQSGSILENVIVRNDRVVQGTYKNTIL